MATSDAEQKSDMVRYRTRMAQGVKLDGTSLQPKGGNQPKNCLLYTSDAADE